MADEPKEAPGEGRGRRPRREREPKPCRVRLFLLGWSLLALCSLVGAHFLTLRYTGTATFVWRTDPATPDVRRRSSESFEATRKLLETELAGYGAMGKVAEDLGLLRGLARDPLGNLTDEGKRARQKIIDGLMDSTEVSWSVRHRAADLLSVTVTHSDPRLAQEIPYRLYRNYMDRIKERIVRRLREARESLLRQVELSRKRLDELRRQKIAFEARYAGLMPLGPGPLRQEYLGIIDKIAREEAKLETWQKRLRMVETALAAEAASRRTHLICVQRADTKVIPDRPRLALVLAVALGLPLAAMVGMELASLVLRRRRRTRRRGLPRWSRVLVTVALVVLLPAVGLAAYSNVLRLRHPAMYEQWRESPVQFIRQQLAPSQNT